MKNTDERVDAYIEKSAPFAKKILKHLRKQVHIACPGVQETIKWGFPHFEYHGMLCFMASFKAHCTFGFWRADLMKEVKTKANLSGEKGMGQFGRIAGLDDLPADKVLLKWVQEAAELNEKGVTRVVKRKITRRKALKAPAYFLNKIKSNKKAERYYNSLSTSHKNEYIEWVTEAKAEVTRNKRMDQMIEWLEEEKPRNWKYTEKESQKTSK